LAALPSPDTTRRSLPLRGQNELSGQDEKVLSKTSPPSVLALIRQRRGRVAVRQLSTKNGIIQLHLERFRIGDPAVSGMSAAEHARAISEHATAGIEFDELLRCPHVGDRALLVEPPLATVAFDKRTKYQLVPVRSHVGIAPHLRSNGLGAHLLGQ